MNGWGMVPLGYAVSEVRQRNIGGREQNLLSLSHGSVVRKDIDSAEGLLPESFDTYNIVQTGDTVLRLTDLQNDQRSLRVGLAEERGIITSAYVSVRPRAGFDPCFLNYYLKSLDFRKTFYALGAGVRQSLRFEELRTLRVPTPPLRQQRAIADFLAEETQRIDAVLAAKRRLIELLAERLTMMAEPAISRAANTWQCVPLRRVVRERDERRGGDLELPLMSVSIHKGVVPRTESTDRESRADDFSNYKVCVAGDIVVNRMRAFQGGLGVAPARGIVSPDYAVLALGPKLNPTYLHFLMRSPWFIGEMTRRLRGIGSVDQGNVRTPRVNYADLSEIAIPLPDASAQAEIITEIKSIETLTMGLTDVLVKQIDVLGEHRQGLITAAVTGELEIPGVAA